ncbi:uncharacterized protein LOC127256780 isoform X2 [Andrographis paniculata]|uniref:uncharacterized protein LOC127256780 isoform X2 n=1 Tax=Andrographis paniculata TaxID=175694 RepID=UPI0021E71D57|nr:uncharacterized protein LOC127256780 isoform X2 [Andrographis paniculata]
MEDDEERQLILRAPGPMESATLGRFMTDIFNTKPRKLQDAISRLHSLPDTPLTVSLERSLWFLHKYIGEAVENGKHLDQVLVPIVQHSSTTRGSQQSLVLLNWLFQDDVLFHGIVEHLLVIISRRDDRYVALGWCILGRNLIEYQDSANNVSVTAIREKNDVLLKMFCPCVTHLISLVCNGSQVREGFELPNRLAIAAADFLLSLTVALTGNDLAHKQKSSSSNAKNQSIYLLPEATKPRDEKTLGKASESLSLELKFLLLNNLGELIMLVEKLTAWSRKSRSLHAKGLERVCKWLKEVKQIYGCSPDETELQMRKIGSLLLSSCWKHYGTLLHLEDNKFNQQFKELIGQFLSGIQFYADNKFGEPNTSEGDKLETINFFLNCLLLLLGKLDNKMFGDAIEEFGSKISQILLSQLQCTNEEVIDGAISIFKAVIFRTNHTLSKRNVGDVGEMDDLMSMLLNFLGDRDAAAKAIVKLVAEYCSICSDSKYLYKVLNGISSKNISQRRNAFDIVSELIHYGESVETIPHATWKDIANYLLECLEDEDLVIQKQAPHLISFIEPPLVLPALVELIYSANEGVQISAGSALTALLVAHKHEPEILCMLLDCISKHSQNFDSGTTMDGKKESRFDADRLLKLLPEWAKTVEDWHVMVGPLIDKMLAEPSNAVMVRFLSYISEYLADTVDVVFHRLLLYTRQQEETYSNSETMKHEHRLFTHLCPLLVIRLLPLRVFDDLDSSLVYGEFSKNSAARDRYLSIEDTECIASLMMNRALSKSEFEDTRKLSAELCGRIHPEVLVPVLSSQLESAAIANDLMKIKVCLFSFCTSLVVRGTEAYSHPDVLRIRKSILNILSWTSPDQDVSKAQHGCIDCLALMLCTELQSPESSRGSRISKIPVLAFVTSQLLGNDWSSKPNGLSFCLCMANVLISACQKISDSAKKPFVKKIIPSITQSLKVITEPEIRAACIQVLFTAAYHLKPFVAPYSKDLLQATLKSLREGSDKEKMAGAKLLACLMTSEEEVVEDISGGLLEAKELLQRMSSMDPSTDITQICRQLLVCFSSP